MARKKKKAAPVTAAEVLGPEYGDDYPLPMRQDGYVPPRSLDLDVLSSLEKNVANHERHIFETRDVIEALIEYLDVDIVPAEEVTPRGLFSLGTVTRRRNGVHYWQVSGATGVARVLKAMWPWLSPEKRSQAREKLDAYLDRPLHGPRGAGLRRALEARAAIQRAGLRVP
jgi:hypothetical protein